MNPSQLADAVLAAAATALAGLGRDPSVLPATTSVERPRHPGHGDYASALALQVAKQAALPPRELAQEIGAEGVDGTDARDLEVGEGAVEAVALDPGRLVVILPGGEFGKVRGQLSGHLGR